MCVAVIGWKECGLVGRDEALVSLESSSIAARLPEDVTVIVLGPGVAEDHAAETVAVWLERFGGATVVLTETLRAGPCSELEASALGELVGADHALEQAADAARNRPLLRMSLADWLGERRHRLSTEDRALLRRVPRLPRLRGYEWARAAGRSEHLLSVATRRLFGRPAGSVLREYRMRAALRLRARGCTMESIAPVLGYSSRAAVSRALRTHGAGLSVG